MASTLPPLQQPLYQIPTPMSSGSPTPHIPGEYGPSTGETPGLEATSMYDNWEKVTGALNQVASGVSKSLGMASTEPNPEPRSPEAWKHEASAGPIPVVERSKTLTANAAQATANAAKNVLPTSVAASLGLVQPIEPVTTTRGNAEGFEELPKLPPPGLDGPSVNTTSYIDQSKSMVTSAAQALNTAATGVLPVGMSQAIGLVPAETPAETRTETPMSDKELVQSPKSDPTPAPPPSKGLQTASAFVAATKHLPPDAISSPISTVTGEPIVAKSISTDADVQEAAANSPHDFTTAIPGHELSSNRQEMLGGPEIQPMVDVEPSSKTTVKITAADVQHPTIGYADTKNGSEGSTPTAPNELFLATQPTVVSLSSTASVVGSSRNSISAPSTANTDANYSPVSPQVNNKHMVATGDQQQHPRSSTSDSSSDTPSPASPNKSGHSRIGSAGKVSLKNKLKGEFKVVKGKMKKDEELVQEGKMLKAGLVPT